MRNLFLAALVLIATSATAVPAMPPELARTTWRWVSLTTPEETLTIAEPERYTLRFADGDRVFLRADCNHGAGSVVFPEPGVIRFGALAITRAMCPTGSPGDRFAREVMRNYDKSGQIAAVIADKGRQAHSPALTGPADPRPICAVAVPK